MGGILKLRRPQGCGNTPGDLERTISTSRTPPQLPYTIVSRLAFQGQSSLQMKKTRLSAIREKGLFIPAYLGALYQPGNAICLGKRAMVKGLLVAR